MRNILKQTSWIFFAQLFGKGIGFFYTIFLAKNLGVEDFGLYSAALTYFVLISAIADFGFNRFLIREVSLNRQKIPELLCNTGLLRLTISAVVFAIFAVGLYLLDPDKLRVSLILLATLAVVPQSLSLTLDAIFIALQKLEYSSVSLSLLSLTTALIGLFLISNGFGTYGALTALILGQLIYLGILLIFIRIQRLTVLAHVQPAVLKQVFLGSLPYGILGILGLLYFRIDTLLLTYLRGNFDTGIYSIAFRFLEVGALIPGTFSIALFPQLAKLQQVSIAEVKKLYFKSIKVMLAISLAIMLIYILILPMVIKAYLPSFMPAIEVVKVLGLAIPFMFLHVSAAQVLLSTEKYLKKLIQISFLPLTLNIILNSIFIPQYGFMAAAWVTLISDVFSFLVLFILIHHYYFKDV